MGVMSAENEEEDGDGEQELFGGRVLVTVVHLLPHVQSIKGPGRVLERRAVDVVEHQVGSGNVAEVCERPRCFLG